jgi:hypothetical protein
MLCLNPRTGDGQRYTVKNKSGSYLPGPLVMLIWISSNPDPLINFRSESEISVFAN